MDADVTSPRPGSGSGEDGQLPADVARLSFDEALAELQQTVASLEAGGQPLEEAITLYERGVALQQHCDRLLAAAELRVRRLVERAGGALEAVEADAEGEPTR
jgi:exodeoxyribonuclease VII small subunit